MMRVTDYIAPMPFPERLKRVRFRAHHRGTREADFMIGGYFDAHHRTWGPAELDWFDSLLREQDVDIMAWAIGTAEPPERFQGAQMEALKTLDFVRLHK